MWKNVENCLILLFEIALVVTVITQIGILKVLTMVVLFPIAVFLSMLTGSDSPGGGDLVLTGETILFVAQGLLWDTAMDAGGLWLVALYISVAIVSIIVILSFERPS